MIYTFHCNKLSNDKLLFSGKIFSSTHHCLLTLDLFVEHVLFHEQETRLSSKVYYIRCKLWLPFTSKAKQTQVKFVTLMKSSNETCRRGNSSDFTVHIIKNTRTAATYLWKKAKLGPKSKESRLFEYIIEYIAVNYTPMQNSRWRTTKKTLLT